MQNEDYQSVDEYDREFIALVTDIEKRCELFKKHDNLRIESWCKKLCQVTNNIEWKKNRNLHAICLLDMMLNKRFEEPYSKFAPEGSIPILSKTIVKSRLSQKFWKNTEAIYGKNQSKEIQSHELLPYEENNININEDKANNNHQEQQKIEKNNQPHPQLRQANITNPNSPMILNAPSSELNQMKEIIEKLKNDLEKKNRVIQNQKEEKTQLTKKVEELEKMLASFLVKIYSYKSI